MGDPFKDFNYEAEVRRDAFKQKLTERFVFILEREGVPEVEKLDACAALMRSKRVKKEFGVKRSRLLEEAFVEIMTKLRSAKGANADVYKYVFRHSKKSVSFLKKLFRCG